MRLDTLCIIDHPLVQHKLTLIRSLNTGPKEFRELVEEIAMLIAYEVTRDLPMKEVVVQTPISECSSKELAGKKTGVVPILRAGLGMVEGILKLIPTARVGHIGLYRNPDTLQPVEYYCKLPSDTSERDWIIADPMLATGGSATAAITCLKQRGAVNVKLACIIASPEGVKTVSETHPEVTIYTAALDSHLNEHGYIIPGLGDAGDRLYGTK